ncbi:uncharacterized protein LAESUDRAFT_726083 [Laetiporus sulphureus 93-53]|uniref:Uncharacterized protein n=1 Tax=Laetiporus sulphureus 93-53 TaxID=1314785 RepID=A0A165E587_9APHY|nr:uncharacterized protein LAESUDRAFT_726083 [Laetiporus sulphureus 93-53]KZT06260.1 hypothetical protein LAESUDRAFT_726083 [Laetiporus sulphureus 93-53]
MAESIEYLWHDQADILSSPCLTTPRWARGRDSPSNDGPVIAGAQIHTFLSGKSAHDRYEDFESIEAQYRKQYALSYSIQYSDTRRQHSLSLAVHHGLYPHWRMIMSYVLWQHVGTVLIW